MTWRAMSARLQRTVAADKWRTEKFPLQVIRQFAPIDTPAAVYAFLGKGLHSLTSQLNLSAFYGIRGARKG